MNTAVLVLLAVMFTADIYILMYAITRKDNSRAAYFVFFTIAVSVYVMGALLYEAAGANRGAAAAALSVMGLGGPILAPVMLLLLMRLYKPKLLSPWMFHAVIIYGLLMFFVILSNERHFLFYSAIEYIEAENYMSVSRGALYWVNQAVVVLCMAGVYSVIIERFIKSGKKIRRQMNYMVMGTLTALVANVLNFTNALPKNMDLLPYVMTFSLALFAADMGRHKIWDVASVASNTVLETMEEALVVLNTGGGFWFCNNSARALLPALESFPITETITKVEDWPEELGASEQLGELREITFELGGTERREKKSTYRATVNKLKDERGVIFGWQIIIYDITEITFLINQLETLATKDPLTGVANRRYFLERVNRELDMAERHKLSTALIMYDIDFFKKVNDTYGHAAGDYILCAVVEAVKQQLRSYDIIARYGGEEFVIFSTSSDEDSLYKFALRLCKAVENAEFVYEGARIPITASFGAVQILPGDKFNEAMLSVDEAMYKAKNNGRNRVVIGQIQKKEEED